MKVPSFLMAAAFASVIACVAAISSASAQTEQRSKKNRPDPAKYSLKIWTKNSLGRGQTVSEMTPYGRLSCMGALMHDRRRVCHWD
jgi:hypothetical protein